MRDGDVYRFGSYELDSGSRRLYRGQEPIALSLRHMRYQFALALSGRFTVPVSRPGSSSQMLPVTSA